MRRFRKETYEKVITVNIKPTPDMPEGIYKVVDANGIYWGTFRVSMNWCFERFVMEWFY